MMKQIKRGVAVAVGLVIAGVAQADPVDYTALTGSVNFSGVVTAILAIAATLAGLFVAIRGAKTVLAMIRGR
jgi:hypothetical protein